MTARWLVLVCWLCFLACPAAAATAPSSISLIEPPYLESAVKAGKLPPVTERLPKSPRIIDLSDGLESGKSGGNINMLMGDPGDLRMMVVYGYTRLVVLDPSLKFVPDILESLDVVDERIFTLHLREGHKWSDGHPFTSEDFRYWWEDVASNTELLPGGPPPEMRPDGRLPAFEVIDKTTVRYTWSKPNPLFMPALAAARPLFIYMPAHYMRKFHKKYTSADDLAQRIAKAKVKDWVSLHEKMGRQFRPENPDLPTLDPWRNTTKGPAQIYVFERNPYFHRRDAKGNQLPYLDTVTVQLGSTSIIPAKVGSGEADLQARYLRFDNYTFLREAERQQHFSVRLWSSTRGSQVCLRPNLNIVDLGWRALFHDVRFRRALSLAIDRHEINNVLFYGLARESGDTVIPESPLFRPGYQFAWAQFDLAEANRLLDEIGLTRHDSDGVRLLSDGRRAEIIVETSGESTEEADVLELIHDTWWKAGIALYTKPTQPDLLRNRVTSGLTMVSVGQGIDNAIPTSEFPPVEFVPSTVVQYQWPSWGLYEETHGKQGEAPDLPEAERLRSYYHDWWNTTSAEARKAVWAKILALYADQVFSIGTVNHTLQPIVVRSALHNVPTKGLFGFDPTAYFGIYRPDTFWLEPALQN
jgi:peptide/nickel transport system substrate-binding protein